MILWLFVDSLVVLRFVAARRSLFGFNALIQCGLAALLLAGVNIFAFFHYTRVDCTRHQEFTLPAETENNLKKLRGETTIVG